MTTFSAGATLREAWNDTIAHVPTLLLTWLASVAVAVAGLIVYWVIFLLFSALDDGSGVGAGMGAIFGQLSSIPFSLLQSLISVLFTAIPAIYYQRGEGVVSFADVYSLLMSRLGRYFLAGVLFTVASTVGIFLCFLPGIIVLASAPIYVNKVFTTDLSVWDCFTSSFASVYGSEKGWALVGLQLLAFLLAFVTCGFFIIGLIIYVPLVTFFLQLYVSRCGLVRAAA
ncbi:hypothetical protein [Synechococcus sp. HK01-R]|uniref:hypothetical protein n=1 Tax=Synechococcus sp. HK01-R TaxID=2751171 RepID=UPI001624DABC|nr:hypothetical protein [Synechococcus sp. HK01-R]QNG27502.1 hypothetical protein H0O21_02430 [Synechococcus sp. HK01-R]